MFKSLLVPLDGSPLAEAILPYVSSLATAMQSDVVLLFVGDIGESQIAPEQKARLQRLAEKHGTPMADYQQQIAERLEASGLKVRRTMTVGEAAEQILEVAQRERVSLIAMSTHGRSGLRRIQYGSVAEKVLRSSPVPVLLVRPKEQAPREVSLAKLLVPLDGSALAETALPYAESVAKRLNSAIFLLRVVPIQHAAYFGPEAGAYLMEMDDQLEQVAKDYLARQRQSLRLRGLNAEAASLRGLAAERIIDFADEQGIDLIVMCSHGRSGIARWVLGSVADKVSRQSGIPVLVIRPQGVEA